MRGHANGSLQRTRRARRYRRVQPFGTEDIGIYQSIFEFMNYAGAISSAAAILYRTNILRGFTEHQRDAIFMVIVATFAALIMVISVLVDDVPFDVELQIKRNEFLNSKIIDRVADECDVVATVHKDTADIVVHQKDGIEPYTTYGLMFGAGAAADAAKDDAEKHLVVGEG